MDGNSLDWRYVQVRRTVIMIEQSIKQALNAYAFSPNTASTWATVQAMIESFLHTLWAQGAMVGPTAQSSFSVDVGLGSTMTAQDIADSIMNVTVKVALTHPGEFIVITLSQKMQGA